jgi:hypothetical protein
MPKEKGSDERLPPEADQHMADQIAADDRRRAAEQANVDVQPEDPQG